MCAIPERRGSSRFCLVASPESTLPSAALSWATGIRECVCRRGGPRVRTGGRASTHRHLRRAGHPGAGGGAGSRGGRATAPSVQRSHRNRDGGHGLGAPSGGEPCPAEPHRLPTALRPGDTNRAGLLPSSCRRAVPCLPLGRNWRSGKVGKWASFPAAAVRAPGCELSGRAVHGVRPRAAHPPPHRTAAVPAESPSAPSV